MGGRDLGGREIRVSLYVKVGWPCGAIRRKFATSLLFSSEVAAFAPLGLPTLTLGGARCGGLPSPSPVLSSRLSCPILSCPVLSCLSCPVRMGLNLAGVLPPKVPALGSYIHWCHIISIYNMLDIDMITRSHRALSGRNRVCYSS